MLSQLMIVLLGRGLTISQFCHVLRPDLLRVSSVVLPEVRPFVRKAHLASEDPSRESQVPMSLIVLQMKVSQRRMSSHWSWVRSTFSLIEICQFS
jgi:hypothetical protein